MNLKIFILLSFLLIPTYKGNAQQWNSLGNGLVLDHFGGVCHALNYLNGVLYAAGYSENINGTNYQTIAQWNGNAWSSVGGVYYGGGISALANMNGLLYACGTFDTINGVAAHNIAQWDGVSWSGLGGGIPTSDTAPPYAMISYNGNLIVGGNFTIAGQTPVSSVASWDGVSWSPMGNGIRVRGVGIPWNQTGDVSAFAIYNGDLYAGGTFYGETGPGDTVYGMAKWDGSAWTLFAPLNFGTGNYFHEIRCLCVYNGNLYAGGDFDSIGGVLALDMAVWNGATWNSVGDLPYGSYSGTVNALTVYKGQLFATGLFTSAGGVPDSIIARFNGTSWLPAGNIGGEGFALLANDNGLYVGGGNLRLGGNALSLVEIYSGPTVIDDVEKEEIVQVTPNPNSGLFSVRLNDERNSTIQIYNVTGEKIMQTLLMQDKTELNLTTQASGVYLYRIISAQGNLIASGKVLIQ